MTVQLTQQQVTAALYATQSNFSRGAGRSKPPTIDQSATLYAGESTQVLQRAAKLKRGGCMQSIDTNGTDFGIPATWRRCLARNTKASGSMSYTTTWGFSICGYHLFLIWQLKNGNDGGCWKHIGLREGCAWLCNIWQVRAHTSKSKQATLRVMPTPD